MKGIPTTLRPILYTREPVTLIYFTKLFRFVPGFLFSTLLRRYVVTVLYLLLRCYDAIAF